MLAETIERVTRATRPLTQINRTQPLRAPRLDLRAGRYRLRLAQSEAEVDAALRLRFAVFNQELREGLAASVRMGRDRDRFDAACHHLLVCDEASGEVVGTYRVQTYEMVARAHGFYSAGEFDLSSLPLEVLRDAVELGRACIAREHRHTRVLYLLWQGLAAYAAERRKRYLFGCCSLTGQDVREAAAVTRLLRQGDHFDARFRVVPRPDYACPAAVAELPGARIPKLFAAYLRFGAKVCGPPALDRAFNTIDYFVLMDLQRLSGDARRLLG